MTDRSPSAAQAGALLALVIVSYFMIVLDASIVITGLPHIQQSLGFSPTGLSWVQNAYTLAFGGLLLLGARAGDLLGRRRMLMAGLTLFTLASAAIGAAQSPVWLVAARAVQGAGAAILAPATLALLTATFPEGPARTRALGFYGATAGISASVGLVVGGLLADLLSWRVGFFINLPVGLALIVAARRLVPVQRAEDTGQRLDVAGAVMSTLGMVGLVYAIVRGAEGAGEGAATAGASGVTDATSVAASRAAALAHGLSGGWSDPVTWALLIGALVLLAGFLRHEARVAQPLLPLRLFADRGRAGAYAARFFFLGGMMGFWFFTTQYLQGVLGMSAMSAGAAYLPATLTNFASAMAAARLTRRFGLRRVLITGLALSTLGVAWLGHLEAGGGYWTAVALPMVLIGLGQGLTLSPLTVAGVSGVDPRDAGAASGVVNVVHQLGGSLGLAALVAVSAAAGPEASATHRFALAFAAAAVLLGAALVAILATGRRASPIPLTPRDAEPAEG